MLITLKLDGLMNLSIFIISSDVKMIDKIVNLYFRDNPDVINLSLNLIIGLSDDLILPFEHKKDCVCPLVSKCNFNFNDSIT